MFCCSLLIPIPLSVITILRERGLVFSFGALSEETKLSMVGFDVFSTSLLSLADMTDRRENLLPSSCISPADAADVADVVDDIDDLRGIFDSFLSCVDVDDIDDLRDTLLLGSWLNAATVETMFFFVKEDTRT